MRRKITKAVVCCVAIAMSVLGISSVAAVTTSAAQAPSHTAGASEWTLNCATGTALYEPFAIYGAWAVAEADCSGNQGSVTDQYTCLQIATVFGWLTDQAYGSNQWGTACDTNDTH